MEFNFIFTPENVRGIYTPEFIKDLEADGDVYVEKKFGKNLRDSDPDRKVASKGYN